MSVKTAEDYAKLYPLLRDRENGGVIGTFFTDNSGKKLWRPQYLREELGTVEFPVHTLTADGVLGREMRIRTAAVIYVNSLPGNVEQSGDGSRENPYVNLADLFRRTNSRFSAAGQRLQCLSRSMGCVGGVVLIKVSGVVDYPLPFYSRFSYNAVLDFGGCTAGENFAVSEASGVVVTDLAISRRNDTIYDSVFADCTKCTFYNCRYTVSGEAYNESLFRNLSNCTVDSCHVTGSFGGGPGGAVLVHQSNISPEGYTTFWNCTAEVSVGEAYDGALQNVSRTVLQNCTVSVEASDLLSESHLAEVYAIYGGSNAIFNDCTAEVRATTRGSVVNAAAFYADDSVFSGCTGRVELSASLRGRGCGFGGFRNVYYDCVAQNDCIGTSDCSECAL